MTDCALTVFVSRDYSTAMVTARCQDQQVVAPARYTSVLENSVTKKSTNFHPPFVYGKGIFWRQYVTPMEAFSTVDNEKWKYQTVPRLYRLTNLWICENDRYLVTLCEGDHAPVMAGKWWLSGADIWCHQGARSPSISRDGHSTNMTINRKSHFLKFYTLRLGQIWLFLVVDIWIMNFL